jgi:hypothetical protein
MEWMVSKGAMGIGAEESRDTGYLPADFTMAVGALPLFADYDFMTTRPEMQSVAWN